MTTATETETLPGQLPYADRLAAENAAASAAYRELIVALGSGADGPPRDEANAILAAADVSQEQFAADVKHCTRRAELIKEFNQLELDIIRSKELDDEIATMTAQCEAECEAAVAKIRSDWRDKMQPQVGERADIGDATRDRWDVDRLLFESMKDQSLIDEGRRLESQFNAMRGKISRAWSLAAKRLGRNPTNAEADAMEVELHQERDRLAADRKAQHRKMVLSPY